MILHRARYSPYSSYIEQEVNIESGSLMEAARPFEVMPGFNLECYPNRDSTIYK